MTIIDVYTLIVVAIGLLTMLVVMGTVGYVFYMENRSKNGEEL